MGLLAFLHRKEDTVLELLSKKKKKMLTLITAQQNAKTSFQNAID